MNKEEKYLLIKEGLERHFKSFYNLKNDYWFFIGIADYIEFIDSNKTTKNLILELIEKKEKDWLKWKIN
jgi:hypothetical protein